MSLIIAIGSEGDELSIPFVKTPEITKANNAKPITRIKKNDLCLICPSTAIIIF